VIKGKSTMRVLEKTEKGGVKCDDIACPWSENKEIKGLFESCDDIWRVGR
jgi:hypothetical protein